MEKKYGYSQYYMSYIATKVSLNNTKLKLIYVLRLAIFLSHVLVWFQSFKAV